MQAHEHHIEDALASRERDVNLLFMTADGEVDGFRSELEALGVARDTDGDDRQEAAREALHAYGLSIETRTVMRYVLGIGGPTVELSATIERGEHGWERVSDVTYFDSWAVPQEAQLADGGALVRLFDEAVELYSPEN